MTYRARIYLRLAPSDRRYHYIGEIGLDRRPVEKGQIPFKRRGKTQLGSIEIVSPVPTECMARPRSASGLMPVGPSSLLQCIRPMSFRPGRDGDPRAPVLIDVPACSTAISVVRSPRRRSTV